MNKTKLSTWKEDENIYLTVDTIMSRKKWLELHNSLKLEYPIVALWCIILGKTYLLHAYWVTD